MKESTTEGAWYDVRIIADGSDVKVWRGERGKEMELVFDVDTATSTTSARIEYRINDENTELKLDNIQILADDLSNTTTYAYNDANELTSMSFGYDALGRMTSKSQAGHAATYSYRYGSKLYAVTSSFPDEADVTYETGGDGLRRSRTSGTDETWYNWGAGWGVLSEFINKLPLLGPLYCRQQRAGLGNGVCGDVFGTESGVRSRAWASGRGVSTLKSIAFFLGAALFEIAGCFSFWAWLRLSRPWWLVLPGIVSLVLFAWCLTRVESPHAGRAYAAYGGIYIASSLLWLRGVEGVTPDRWDIIGSIICGLGALVILFGPRP